MHDFNGFDNCLPVHALSRFIYYSGYCAAGWYSHLSFALHIVTPLVYKKGAHHMMLEESTDDSTYKPIALISASSDEHLCSTLLVFYSNETIKSI